MLIIILTLALALRLISLNQSLWLDEAINAQAVRALSYKDLIFKYSIGDFHPPLYHIILKLWTNYTGDSEIALRAPSVLFGMVTVFVTFLIGKELFDKKTGAIAAILLATSPLAIYYSQEARMYALAAMLSSLSVYFFIKVLKSEKTLNWLGFILATALALLSDYLPYFLIPTYIIFMVFMGKKLKKGKLAAFLPALILILVLIAPWLAVLPKQFTTGLAAATASPAWSKVVGSPTFKSAVLVPTKFTIGRISVQNKVLYALIFVPVGIIELLLFFFASMRFSRQRSFLVFWLAVPLVLGFVTAFYIPIFSYFRFLFVLPAFYLLFAAGINTLNWPKLNRGLLAIFLAINLTATFIYLFNPNFHRENWREAVNYVKSNSDNKTVVLFEDSSPIAPFNYYAKDKVTAAGGINSYSPEEKAVEKRVEETTNGKSKIFLFQYLVEISDPGGLLFRTLSEKGFQLIRTRDFQNIGFLYEFRR